MGANLLFKSSLTTKANDMITYNAQGEATINPAHPFCEGAVYFTADGYIVYDYKDSNNTNKRRVMCYTSGLAYSTAGAYQVLLDGSTAYQQDGQGNTVSFNGSKDVSINITPERIHALKNNGDTATGAYIFKGPVTVEGIANFLNSVTTDSLTTGHLVVNGAATFNNGLYGHLTGDVTGNISGNAGTATKLAGTVNVRVEDSQSTPQGGAYTGFDGSAGSYQLKLPTKVRFDRVSINTDNNDSYRLLVNGDSKFFGAVTFTQNPAFVTTNYTSYPLQIYDDGTTYGHTMVLEAGGTVYLGAGESASALRSALGVSSTENLYLGADNIIGIYTNCQTVANRVGFTMDTSLNIEPYANNKGSFGTSSKKWNKIYATNFYGDLDGTAAKATADAGGNNIADTYLKNVSVNSSDPTLLQKTTGNNATTDIGHFVPIASKDSTIDIKYIPAAALERLIVVANAAARKALTVTDAQLGDVIKESDTGLMYFVKDTSKLNSDDGYEIFKAGTAVSAKNDGGNNEIAAYYGHSLLLQNQHLYLKSATNANLSDINLTPTGLGYLSRTGDTTSGNYTFNGAVALNGSTTASDLTVGDLIVNGTAQFNGSLKGNLTGIADEAKKVSHRLILQNYSGTNIVDFNGSADQTAKLTAATVRALDTTGGTMTGHIYLNGITSSGTTSTTKIIFGDSTTNYAYIAASTSHAIGFLNNDGSNGIVYAANENSFRPFLNNTTATLGTDSAKWAGVYATTFYGNATSADKVNKSITIKANDVALGTYDGSEEKTFNINYTNTGALGATQQAVDSAKLDGWILSGENDNILYKYNQTFTRDAQTANDTWYLKIRCDAGYVARLSRFLLHADYHNINGAVYLDIDGYNTYFRAYCTNYNGCNIKSIAHVFDGSKQVIYLKVQGYANEQSRCAVYSPWPILSMEAVDAPTGITLVDLVYGYTSNTHIKANTFYGTLSGNASSASSAAKWTTARNFKITDVGNHAGTAVSVNGTTDIDLALPTGVQFNTIGINGYNDAYRLYVNGISYLSGNTTIKATLTADDIIAGNVSVTGRLIANLTGNVTGNVTGNADTASKFKNSIGLSIKDYDNKKSGSVSELDGSADVVLHMPSHGHFAKVSIGSFNESYGLYVDGTSYFNDTMTLNAEKQIIRNGFSSSWINGRDRALIRQKTISGYSPAISIKTTNGSWELGAYNESSYTDKFIFSFASDAKYNASTNSTNTYTIDKNGNYSGNAATASKVNHKLTFLFNHNVFNNNEFDGSKDISIDITPEGIGAVKKNGGDTLTGDYSINGNLTVSSGATISNASIDSATLGHLIVNGAATFNNGIYGDLIGNISGNAATANKLAAAHKFYIKDASGAHTGSETASDLSSSEMNFYLPATISAALVGNADTATTSTYLTASTAAYSKTADDAMPAVADRMQLFRVGPTSGATGSDGHLLGFTWTNTTSYGAQIYIDTDPTGHMSFRQRKGDGTWSNWNQIMHSNNVGSYAVKKSASSIDNQVVRWDGTWGNAIQGSSMTIDDSGNATIGGKLTVSSDLSIGGSSTLKALTAGATTLGSLISNGITYLNDNTYAQGIEATDLLVTGPARFDGSVTADTFTGNLVGNVTGNATSADKVNHKLDYKWNHVSQGQFDGSNNLTIDIVPTYQDLKPVVSKKYESTSYYATSANSWDTSTWYFMYVKPTSWYKPWKVRFKVRTTSPGHENYDSTTWSTISGRAGEFIYANWNERYDHAHYYLTGMPLKQAGFTSGYKHAIGVSILSSNNYTNSSYYRTFEVDYYDCDGCTVEIVNSPVKQGSIPGYNSTNFDSIRSFNAIDRGLMESGDSDSYANNASAYYLRQKAGVNGYYGYSIVTVDSNDCLSGFVKSYSTGSSKTKNDVSFKIGAPFYYHASGATKTSGQIADTSAMRLFYTLIDYRYFLNAAQGSLTANMPVYLVGTLATDGSTYTLPDTWWTQTLPTTDDSKVYIYLGTVYPDSSTYRMSWEPTHQAYIYKDGALRAYTAGAGTALKALTDDGGNTFTSTYISSVKVNSSDSTLLQYSKPNNSTTDIGHFVPLASADSKIDIKYIPAAALERLTIVANAAARKALTADTVQLGDVVKETDTGLMYYVKDTTKLNQDAGYELFVAGAAAKATSDEDGNSIKNYYAHSLALSNRHLYLKSAANGNLSDIDLTPTSLGYINRDGDTTSGSFTFNGSVALNGSTSASDLTIGDMVVNGSAKFNGAIIGNLTGNADTASSADKWTTARNFTIKDSTSTYGGTAVSVNGTSDITLLMPANGKFTKLGINSNVSDSYQAYINGTTYLNNSLYIKAGYSIQAVGTKATYTMIRFLDNTSNAYGNGISIGGGGVTVVGAGESSSNFTVDAGDENLYLMADNSIKFYTYCDTLANKRGIIMGTAREFYPDSNGTGSLGTNSYWWSNAHINTIYAGSESYYINSATSQLNALTLAGQLTSNVANGTAPFKVTSATKVDNLNADKLDGYHRSGLYSSPGEWIAANEYTELITIDGDANTYYPVVIKTPTEKSARNFISIWKNLGSQTATYQGNHSNGSSSMWLQYEVRNWYWDGNGGYCKCWYYSMPYAPLCAKTEMAGVGLGALVVYLRGGGTNYYISTTYNHETSAIYYVETDAFNNATYPAIVKPVTELGNCGKISSTVLGYGDISGNASTATLAAAATKLNTQRSFSIKDVGSHAGSAQSFDGTADVELPLPANIQFTSVGVNGYNTAYKLYVNGTSYLTGNTTVKATLTADDIVAGNLSVTGKLVGNLTGNISGNAATANSAGKWTTARSFTIKDYNNSYAGTATSVDGSEDETLHMPTNGVFNTLSLGTARNDYHLYVNGSAYHKGASEFNGNATFYTQAGTNKVYIARNGLGEAVAHWVDDDTYHIDYTNDETASNITFKLINTDTEAPHSPSQASTSIIYFKNIGDGKGRIYADYFHGTADKVAHTLTLQHNGTAFGSFNGSADATWNLTPAILGAAKNNGDSLTGSYTFSGPVAMNSSATISSAAIDSATIGNLVVTGAATFNNGLYGTLYGSLSGNATSADKVNHGLTIETNGTSQGTYDGSETKSWNITYANVGALKSDGTAVAASSLASNGQQNVVTNRGGNAKLIYSYHINNGTTGLFDNNNNANAIITLNKHDGNYDSQIGFSNKGGIYYRNFNGSAIDSTTAWKQIAFTDSSITGNAASADKVNHSLTYSWNNVSQGTFDGSNDLAININPHHSDLTPVIHKEYTGTSYYATSSGSWDTSTWYFMSIKPKSWYKAWTVRCKIRSWCPGYTNYDSTTWVTLSGRSNGSVYMNWNERQDYAHYYTVLRSLTKAGFDAELSHAFGISILYAGGYTTAAYYRNFEVDYYDCEGCDVTILDAPVKWSAWANNSSTNYNGVTNMNAVDRGLQESGDANDTTTIYSYYDRYTAGTNGIMRYSLVMQDCNGKWQSFTTTSGTDTTKTKNSVGFKLGDIAYSARGSDTTNGNLVDYGNIRKYQSLIDYRYSFNCGTSLAGNKMLYIVGSVHDDGLFYLDDTWWTQTLPSSEDGKIYIPVGIVYPDSSTYRCDFSGWHAPLIYKDNQMCGYNERAYVKRVTSTNHAIPKFNGTTGLIQNSGVLIDDSNNVTIPGGLNVSGASGLAAVTASSISVSGAAALNGSSTISDATIGDLVVSGAAKFNGTIDGNITSADRLNITSTDNAIARFDGTNGKIQNSIPTINDTGNIVFGADNIGIMLYNSTGIYKRSGGNLTLKAENANGYLDLQIANESTYYPIPHTSAASITDNAVVRWDGNRYKIQNSTTTIDDTGNMVIENTSGGDIKFTLKRGSNTAWEHKVSGGNYYLSAAGTQMLSWKESSQNYTMTIEATATIDGHGKAAPLTLKGGTSGYSEGLRIMAASNNWSDILLAGADNTAASGTSANSWFIGNQNGNFYITRNGSNSGSAMLSCISNAWSFSTGVSMASTLAVAGKATLSGLVACNNTTDSSHSADTAASLVVAGGASVAKQLSAKVIRIDNAKSNEGVTLVYDDTTDCLKFVFI